MSYSDAFANDLLLLILHGTAIAGLADNAASAPLTEFYAALHAAAPGAAQSDDEVAYTGYGRVAIARSAGGWDITGPVANPAVDVVFPLITGGGGTDATHWSIGTVASGAGKVLLSGKLAPALLLTEGQQPRVTAASTLTLATPAA